MLTPVGMAQRAARVVSERAPAAPIEYVCPSCRAPLPDSLSCACGFSGRSVDGILDLVPEQDADERRHYDGWYAGLSRLAPIRSPEEAAAEWRSRYYPVNEKVLARVGAIAAETVLLLGNGSSLKELYFAAKEPAALIVSDISVEALRRLRAAVAFDAPIHYVAIDGRRMPLPDGSVDLVYGYAFVHHLEDVEAFLREVARVLRPGGRCLFMDNGYTPAYQRLKLGLLRPLFHYFHARGSTSPEDLRATLRGGFREDELTATITALSGRPFFERDILFQYLVARATERLPPRPLMRWLGRQDWLMRALTAFDRKVTRLPGLRENRMRMIWGFTAGS
jgi:SAM-dependent methyltransferase